MEKILGFIPFVMLSGSGMKLDKKAILQGIIIGCSAGLIGGLLSSYILIARIDERVAYQEKRIVELQANDIKMEARFCDENKRQEARIDYNLTRLEKLTEAILHGKIK